MKITIIGVALIFSLASCRQPDRVVITKWDNENPKVTLDFRNIEDSTYTKTEYFETGKIKSTQEFVNARLNGKLTNYSETGFKQQEFDYVDGQKNGIGTAWYESGKIAFQFKFKDGLPYDGTEYFEDGWPRVLVKYSAPGQMDGKALYYKEDGHIWLQGYYKNGKEDSVWTKFNKIGVATEITKYKDGEIIK